MASIDPQLAQGLLKNYLAIQQEDGWIDGQPGLGGQHQGTLCMPILARLAWALYQNTEDEAFLGEVLPGLTRFFERWISSDADRDGLPEWQDEGQTGYRFWPSFLNLQPWGINTPLRMVETPDLLAYLLSEAASLRAMAAALKDEARQQQMDAHIERLQEALASLWDPERGRYSYRDRDTHLTQTGSVILDGVPGDSEQILALPLDPPSRLNVRIDGGVSHTPRMTMHLKGLDAQGASLDLKVDSKTFIWQNNRGFFTTEQVFSQVDLVQCEGLSRVYKLSISTPDHSRLDLNALLPLISGDLPTERRDALIALLTDSSQFWQPNGLSLIPAQDPNYDLSNANGASGVYSFWLTLMGEALIEAGRQDLAVDLLQRLLQVQETVLSKQRQFYEFYHCTEPLGSGTPGHLGGIVPLHLLMRVLGLRIVSAHKVWTGGPYPWPQAVTVRQHGISVTRDSSGTTITFPSGQETRLPATAEWQAVSDD